MFEKFLKSFSLMFVFAILSLNSFAHCIWVELPMTSQVGRSEQVYAYFAEPYDSIERRDMSDLNLSIRHPNGKIEKVDMIQNKTYYEYSKQFAEQGEYVFILEREPALRRGLEIRDFGKSISWVGEKFTNHNIVGHPLEFAILSNSNDLVNSEEISLVLLYNGEPFSTEVSVYKSLEANGRVYDRNSTKIKADENGILNLKIDRNYNYIVEARNQLPASQVNDALAGSRNIRFRSTLYLSAK